MTRFTASSAQGRRSLIEEAIVAHRDRNSPFCTLEGTAPPPDGTHPAWVQYSCAQGELNMDCRPEERDRLAEVLEAWPNVTITDQQTPDEKGGTNVRLEVYGDPKRIATLIEEIFNSVFGYPDDYELVAATV